MQVSAILDKKGKQVHTITPGASILTAATRLRELGIGALVVSEDAATVTGILSERDIVHALAEDGENVMERPVSDLMTKEVLTCALGDTGRGVLGYMTENRIRHMPVLEGGRLAGMISIGDVVKSRLDEIMHEADVLREYISQT